MRFWWFLAAALVAIGLAAVGITVIGPRLAARSAVDYLTANATRTNVTAEVVANGNLEPANTYSFSFGTAPAAQAASTTQNGSGGNQPAASGGPSVSWPVTAVNVAVGDQVTANETLATADTSDLEAQISVAEAQVTAAQAQVDAGGSDQAVANAQANLLSATKTLDALEAAKQYPSLVAPAAGVVTAVDITTGSDAPSGAAIVVVSDAMVATGTVTESDVSTLAVGQTATVTVTALGSDVTGTVSAVAPTGSSTSGVVGFGVLVALDETPAEARAGMSADISVVTAEADGVIAVPSVALSGSAGSYTVTVIDAAGATQTQPVEVGLVTNNLAEITSGLTVGDEVVTGTSSAQQATTTGGFGLGGGGFGGGRFFGGGGGGN